MKHTLMNRKQFLAFSYAGLLGLLLFKTPWGKSQRKTLSALKEARFYRSSDSLAG